LTQSQAYSIISEFGEVLSRIDWATRLTSNRLYALRSSFLQDGGNAVPGIDWPLDVNEIRRNSERHTFGLVRRNSAGQVKAHQGWDFQAMPGTICYAIADGSVALTYESPDYGKVLVLGFRHEGEQWYAAYAHLSAILVDQGDAITKGMRVARSGETGNAVGMPAADKHLHFEIRSAPRPGPGLQGRVSPYRIFGRIPLTGPINKGD
jgi:peptidoglycan LD-endopeptidase LytH